VEGRLSSSGNRVREEQVVVLVAVGEVWVRPWSWEGNFLFNSPTGDERARREKVHGNVLD